MNKFEKKLHSVKFSPEHDFGRQVVAKLPKDWIQTRGFDFAAGCALRIGTSDSSAFRPALRLFKVANLDPKIPWHWPMLLNLVAWCIYHETRGPGAPKKWTAKKCDEFRRDVATLKLRANKSSIGRTLRKKFPDKYGKYKPGYLRKLAAHLTLDGEALQSILPQTSSTKDRAEVVDLCATAIQGEISIEQTFAALNNRSSQIGQ